MDELYVKEHERFVAGHAGGSMGEILLVTSVGPLSVLLRNLAIPWIFPTKLFVTGSRRDKMCKFLLDYVFIVIPTVLALTVFSDHVICIIFTLCVCCLILLNCSLCEYYYLHRERMLECTTSAIWREFVLLFPSTRLHSVTYFRASVYIATVISILAVDFPCYPRRFAKTEQYGYSLMDTGVGVFVFLFGLMAPEAKIGFARLPPRQLPRFLVRLCPLILLGFLRLLFVKLSGYQEHVTEYGLHWNFFFTLALVKLLILTISLFMPLTRYCGLLCILIILLYEHISNLYSLDRWIFADKRDPANFFDANREGLISLIGYLVICLTGCQSAPYLLKLRRSFRDWSIFICKLCLFCFITFAALKFWEFYLNSEASRRLANFTYCLWIVFFCTFHLVLFTLVEFSIYFSISLKLPLFSSVLNDPCPYRIFEPCLLQAVNKYGLAYFLLANVLTGLVNLLIRTIYAQSSHCFAYLTAYSLTLSLFVYVPYVRNLSNFYV